MFDSSDSLNPRFDDPGPTPEFDDPLPVVIGDGKAFCWRCNTSYDYNANDIRRFCPGCCRTPFIR